MATKTLQIDIIGADKGATKVFRDVDAAAGTTQGKLQQLGEKIGPAVTTAAAAVVGGVTLALKGAFDAAAESARIGRETTRVIETTGAAAWTSADKVGALAQSISEVTGADDELIQSGANLLLTFTQIQNHVGKGNDVFDQATRLALDMSTALGVDMNAASIQLGKALNNPVKGITALSRAGVSFTAEQKDQIKTLVETGNVLDAQKIILGELSTEFGGAAEAAGTPLDKLKVKIGNLQESLGTALTPAVNTAVGVLSSMTDSFMALPGPVQTIVELVAGLGTAAFGATALVAKLSSMFGDTIGPVLQFFKGYVDDAALGIANLATKFGASQEGAANFAAGLSGALGPALLGVGAAAVIGFGIWTMYQQEQKDADARAKAFSDTLDEQTGKLTANTMAHVESTLAGKHQLDNLNKARVSVAEFSTALADNSSKLSASKVELLELAGIDEKASITKDGVIEKLKKEGGARNDLVVKLAQEDALDRGLINTILEQVDAYDDNQEAIKNKIYQQSLANGKTEEEARAAADAAAKNLAHADTIKAVADELRATTDPYFAAFRGLESVRTAQKNYDDAVKDSTKTDFEKQSAYIALASAAAGYKGDLLALDEQNRRNGTSNEDLSRSLQNLKEFGLDRTGKAAYDATGTLMGLGNMADAVGQKEVGIPVTLEMQDVNRRLGWLKTQIDPSTGTIGLGAIWEMQYHAKGGMVQDGPFMVGEQGPELGVKSGSNVRIYSNPDTRRMLGASSGDVTNNIVINMPVGSNGSDVINAIRRYEKTNGKSWRN